MNQPKKSSVKVSIIGEEYTIRSDRAPEHTKAVAEFLDGAIRRALGSGSNIEPNRAAILAAMQIADELLGLRESNRRLENDIRQLTEELRPLLPPAKRRA